MNIKRHSLPLLNIELNKIYATHMKKALVDTPACLLLMYSNDDSGEDECSLCFNIVQFVKSMVLSACINFYIHINITQQL